MVVRKEEAIYNIIKGKENKIKSSLLFTTLILYTINYKYLLKVKTAF